jgi:hypothetical protein
VVMRALERDPGKRYPGAAEMGDDLEALVLRKSYSTRALARKARELVEATGGGTVSAPVRGAAAGESLAQEPPIRIGREDSSRIVEDLPPPPRPPLRKRATTTDRIRVLGRGVGKRFGDRFGDKVGGALGKKTIWLALGLPSILIAALVWAVSARPAPQPARSAAPAPPDPPPSATVQVALDSVPQGAAVTAAAIRGGDRLGETPLLLRVPRSAVAVDFVLTKPGFGPLLFKVIPHQDKDVVAKLEPAERPPTTPAVAVSRPAGGRSAAAARHLTAPGAGAPAKIAKAPLPPRTVAAQPKAVGLASTRPVRPAPAHPVVGPPPAGGPPLVGGPPPAATAADRAAWTTPVGRR